MEFHHKKKWGQHFLHDANITRKIAAQAELCATDAVWEVGAGRGILTQALLDAAGTVTTFEIDPTLLPELQARFAEPLAAGRLRIVHLDVLRADWSSLLPPQPVALAANLPYQITSPFLFKLVEHAPRFRVAVLMMQREVALRLHAQPGTKDYGALTLRLGLHFSVEYLFTVEPHLFTPPPNVRSAVVRLRPRSNPPQMADPALFDRLVETAFANRRKMLRGNLRTLLNDDQLRLLGERFDLTRRGESLHESEFVALCYAVADLR